MLYLWRKCEKFHESKKSVMVRAYSVNCLPFLLSGYLTTSVIEWYSVSRFSYVYQAPKVLEGENKKNVMLKKLFMYAMIAFAGIALMSCDKDKNNANDPKTDNPYPYLRVDDLMPLEMIPISQAEEKLAQMGFKGGWKQEGNEEFYLYVSDSKKDSIFLYVDTEGLVGKGVVTTVSYQASKGVIPSDAKEWLAHIPETVALPERISQLTKANELPFFYAVNALPSLEEEDVYYTYQEYITGLQNLSSGMQILAMWGSGGVPNNYPTGYYGGVEMVYNYMNGRDMAILMLYGFYHEQDDNEPIMPEDE